MWLLVFRAFKALLEVRALLGSQGVQGIQGITGTGLQGVQGITGIQGANGVIDSNTSSISGSTQVLNVIVCTQAQYDALPVKVSTTLYIIVG